jgi:hypothetical protein
VGSFCEIVMSFPLRPDVGEEVLSAFASIAVPSDDAPTLPLPAIANGPWDVSDPWANDWGAELGTSFDTAYIGSDQGATMLWRGRRWVVTARSTWKAWPVELFGHLAVLGTVIDASSAPQYWDTSTMAVHRAKFFVGYARHEAEPRPWLLWADGDTLTAENLNPPEHLTVS